MAETLEPSLVGEIDTSAPFESVREAATRFGGFGFWKPSSLNISEASQNEVGMVLKASELEKELIEKEGETLKVLKSLESTKAIVEELKSKIQNKEDKENCDMNVFKELNQAKMNLCKTTKDLAAIRVSVGLLNKRLEEERAALEKTRERLNSENAAEMSMEIQRLSYEAKEFSRTGENVRYAVNKAVAEIEQTRNKIEAAEMRLIAARKMKEAARAAEAVAIAEIKAVTRRGRRRRRGGNGEETMQEEILETIDETAREIRSSRRTLEEGLAKMEAEEGNWWWTEQRRRSSCSAKFKNPPYMMDVKGLNMMMNGDGTSSSVAVLKPTMSIGQILSRKLLLADESAMMMNGRVSLGQILGKTNFGDREKEKRFNGKRKRFGFANLSVMLNKESKKKNKNFYGSFSLTCYRIKVRSSQIGIVGDNDSEKSRDSKDEDENERVSGKGVPFIVKLGLGLGLAMIITVISVALKGSGGGGSPFEEVKSLAKVSSSSEGFTFNAFGNRFMIPGNAPGWVYFWLLMAAGCGLFISEEALNIWVGITLARMLTLDGTWQSFAESFSRNAPYIVSTVSWVYWGVCLSDMIPFYIGKLFRQSGASDDVCSKLGIGKEKALSITQAVQKYGNLSGFVERFSVGMRNPTAFFAGALGISPECFFAGVCCGGLITLPLQLVIGFLLRERPMFALAAVATAVGIWTIFPYVVAASTALFLYIRSRYSTKD